MLKILCKKVMGLTFSFLLPVLYAAAAPQEDFHICTKDAELKDNAKGIAVEARYFMPKLTYTMETTSSASGQKVTLNFRDSLDIRNVNAPELKATWGKFELDYIRVHQDGDRLLSEPINYHGYQFNNVALHTIQNVDYVSLDWKQKIYHKDWLNVYGGTGLKLYYTSTSLQGKAEGTDTHKITNTMFRAVPTVSLGVTAYLDKAKTLALSSNFSGMTMGCYGYVYDYEAGLRYQPNKKISVLAGYRAIDMNADMSVHDTDRPMYRLRGPYVGLAGHF